jgi:hypothetical protein
MSKVIYGFEMDTETKRVKTFGNIRTQEAIKVMQDILIAELSAPRPVKPEEKEKS